MKPKKEEVDEYFFEKLLGEELRGARKTIGILLPLIKQTDLEDLLSELYDFREIKRDTAIHDRLLKEATHPTPQKKEELE